MDLKQKENFQANCHTLHKKHFNGDAKLGKYPFVRRNVISYWGQAQKYSDGWQVQIAWHTLNLPEWLTDYIIIHELVHTVDKTRRYGAMHTPTFWAMLKKIYPLTNEAERALKQLPYRKRGQCVELPQEWLKRHAEPNGNGQSKTWVPPKEVHTKNLKTLGLIREGETAMRFQRELAEKYGW